MKKMCLVFLILFGVINLQASINDFTGVYSFNKGLNKANATLYVFQFKEDSAFIYYSGLSGMPDFNTTSFKGYISIDLNTAIFPESKTCSVNFLFSRNEMKILDSNSCTFEMNPAGKYKKINSNPKKSATMMLDFTEKKGEIKDDTVKAFFAPHQEASVVASFKKGESIKIIDQYKQYYLIEHKSKKNEFTWVLKSQVTILK